MGKNSRQNVDGIKTTRFLDEFCEKYRKGNVEIAGAYDSETEEVTVIDLDLSGAWPTIGPGRLFRLRMEVTTIR